MPSAPRPRLALVLLACIIAAGGLLRLAALQRAPLRDDELNHYYVAQALARGGPPALPSGEWYLRGLEYTRAVQVTLPHVRSTETAVRLPSALLGTIALPLFALIAWSMAGPRAAVLATLLMAAYPEMILQSRNGRFYTLQLVCGLVAFLAGWRIIAGDPARTGADVARRWAWALVALAALGFANRLQVTTASVALGLGAMLAVIAAVHVRSAGRSAFRWSVPLQLVTLGALATAALFIARPDAPATIVIRAVSSPAWAAALGSGPAYYLDAIAASLPFLVVAGGAAFWFVIRRRPVLGLYLVLWFGVPLALHSALPWRSSRFLLLALPALFLAVAIAFARLLEVVFARVVARLPRRRPARILAWAATCTIALLAVTPTTAFSRATYPVGRRAPLGWQESLAIAQRIRAAAGTGPVYIAHSRSLPAFHYWGGIDFTVNEGLREQWLIRARKVAQLGIDEPGGYVWLPQGSADLYTGAPVLTTPEAIRAHYPDGGAVLIGLDSGNMLRNGIRPELARVLETEAVELCAGGCGAMLLYLWRFGNE